MSSVVGAVTPHFPTSARGSQIDRKAIKGALPSMRLLVRTGIHPGPAGQAQVPWTKSDGCQARPHNRPAFPQHPGASRIPTQRLGKNPGERGGSPGEFRSSLHQSELLIWAKPAGLSHGGTVFLAPAKDTHRRFQILELSKLGQRHRHRLTRRSIPASLQSPVQSLRSEHKTKLPMAAIAFERHP